MFNWNDFMNDFPYTNFSDINVSWFLNKFKQIFDEWEGLYNQMLSWKTATDEYNATWRAQQEQAFTTWENNFETAIDAWKVQTENDIGTWETDTIATLEAWKAVFINQYNALRVEVEQIAEDAETAKNSAQASATSAQNSADSASATALALQASLTQINTNTIDISELKTQLINTENTVLPLLTDKAFKNAGYIRASDGTFQSATNNNATDYLPVKAGDKFYIKSFVDTGRDIIAYYTDKSGNGYIKILEGDRTYKEFTYEVENDGYVRFACSYSDTYPPIFYYDGSMPLMFAKYIDNEINNESAIINGTINEFKDVSELYNNIIEPQFSQGDLSISNYEFVISESSRVCYTDIESPFILPIGAILQLNNKTDYEYIRYTCGVDGKWYIATNTWISEDYTSIGERRTVIKIRKKSGNLAPSECEGIINVIYQNKKIDRDNEAFYKTFSVADHLKYTGLFWTTGNGLASDNVNSSITEFIPVKAGQKIYYKLITGSSQYAITLYDSDYKFISGVTVNDGTYTVESDGYVRFAKLNANDGFVYFDYELPDRTKLNIEEIESDITAIYNTIDAEKKKSALYSLPDTWLNRVQSIQNAQGTSFTFGVQTDTHLTPDKLLNVNLINNLSKLTEYIGFDFICNLGDLTSGALETTPTNEMLVSMSEMMQRYVANLKSPLFVIPGNHDINKDYAQTIQNDPSYQITKEEMYARIIPFVKNSSPNVKFNGRSLYYYCDFEDYGIRAIFMNTTDGNINKESFVSASNYTISNEQKNWFENIALDTNKKVMIFMHVPLISALTSNTLVNGENVLNIIKAFKNNGGTVIGCFYGHTHVQDSAIDDGILHITFNNGGTCAEIVTVDIDNKTIKTYGLGNAEDGQHEAISDRTFTNAWT